MPQAIRLHKITKSLSHAPWRILPYSPANFPSLYIGHHHASSFPPPIPVVRSKIDLDKVVLLISTFDLFDLAITSVFRLNSKRKIWNRWILLVRRKRMLHYRKLQ
ncbi:hypothetical protein L1987_66623 [Smallanthus sonchifolius]|uniref:Uncharacterized protein n=1 Tax=Smallanthus sonchifolius TaxID=185202 RepID=A0ACB9BXU2_9ASTR|nr:hypothetical protein L1987_66623 [Smallanthus sonchifolius]